MNFSVLLAGIHEEGLEAKARFEKIVHEFEDRLRANGFLSHFVNANHDDVPMGEQIAPAPIPAPTPEPIPEPVVAPEPATVTESEPVVVLDVAPSGVGSAAGGATTESAPEVTPEPEIDPA